MQTIVHSTYDVSNKQEWKPKNGAFLKFQRLELKRQLNIWLCHGCVLTCVFCISKLALPKSLDLILVYLLSLIITVMISITDYYISKMFSC